MEPSRKRPSLMLFAIEINLLLWMAAFGASHPSPSWADWTDSQIMMLIGFAFAAVAQHWAY